MTAAPPPRTSRASMVVAALSTVVEWYDFTLYLYFAGTLGRVFFGAGDGALVETLGGFAVAYLMRPLGAIVFGHLGDRHGRRRMMLTSMASMTAAMLATACLPTHAQAGAVAGWLLILLRCVMGFSVGGEYTGVVAYLLECAPPARRGLITSSASAASEVGGLLASAVAAATVAWVPAGSLDSWGWRIPFLVGAALAGGVLLARSSMDESPDFARQRERRTVPANPLRLALRHHRAGVLRGFAISALGSITYYVGITYVPTFLASIGRVPEGRALWISTAAALIVIGVTPAVGLAADRFGRRPVLLAFAAMGVLLPAGAFLAMAHASGLGALTGAGMLALLGGGVSAVGAVATAEQFPGEGRLSGLALGVTTATAIFGGLTPLVAQLATRWTGSPLVPGAMIALVALAVLPILYRLPETRPDDGAA